MSRVTTPDGAGWVRVEPRFRRVRRAGYGSRWQRMRRQVLVAILHELSLSLHLLLLVVSCLPWVFRLDDDFSIWTGIDRDLVMAAFFLTIAASIVAFMLGQRDVNNPITELQAGTAASRQDVVLARMIGMILTSWLYVSVVVGGHYLLGFVAASWGRPDFRVLIPIFLWPVFLMPLMVVLGDRTNGFKLRPIMWLALASVLVWGVHMAAWSSFVNAIVGSLSWPMPPPHTAPNEAFNVRLVGHWGQWLLAGAGVLAAAMLLLPRRFGHGMQRWKPVGLVSCCLLVLALGAVMQVRLMNATGYPARVVTGDLTSCVTGETYDACTHPADASMVRNLDDAITEVTAPIAGTDVLPLQIEFVPVGLYGERIPRSNPFPRPEDSEVVVLPVQLNGYVDDESFQTQLIQRLFTIDGWSTGDGTVRKVIQAWWMLELGFTPESSWALAYAMGDAGERPGGYVPPDLTPHIEQFASVPDVERRAWLEAKWAGLRAGELTLEDLP